MMNKTREPTMLEKQQISHTISNPHFHINQEKAVSPIKHQPVGVDANENLIDSWKCRSTPDYINLMNPHFHCPRVKAQFHGSPFVKLASSQVRNNLVLSKACCTPEDTSFKVLPLTLQSKTKYQIISLIKGNC